MLCSPIPLQTSKMQRMSTRLAINKFQAAEITVGLGGSPTTLLSLALSLLIALFKDR